MGSVGPTGVTGDRHFSYLSFNSEGKEFVCGRERSVFCTSK